MVRKSYEREAFVSLAAVTAAETGDEVAFPARAPNDYPKTYTWEMVVTGAPTTVDADLEGCIGDPDTAGNWFIIDTSTITASELRHVVDKRIMYLRVILNTLTGGTTPTVTARILA